MVFYLVGPRLKIHQIKFIGDSPHTSLLRWAQENGLINCSFDKSWSYGNSKHFKSWEILGNFSREMWWCGDFVRLEIGALGRLGLGWLVNPVVGIVQLQKNGGSCLWQIWGQRLLITAVILGGLKLKHWSLPTVRCNQRSTKTTLEIFFWMFDVFDVWLLGFRYNRNVRNNPFFNNKKTCCGPGESGCFGMLKHFQLPKHELQ